MRGDVTASYDESGSAVIGDDLGREHHEVGRATIVEAERALQLLERVPLRFG